MGPDRKALSTSKKLAFSAAALLMALLVGEGLARAWVHVRWPEHKAHQLTHATETRGRFTTHPVTGYALAPGFSNDDRHQNSDGLRGAEIGERKPGVTRIAIVGASTVYGIYSEDPEATSASTLARLLGERGVRAQVLNGGVPGWTSRETRLSYPERIAVHEPDILIVMDGRNDAFPQLWNEYRDDYSHYRDPDYQLATSNLAWKRVFRVSHLVMVLVSKGELFGFSMRREHPFYGALRMENRPTAEEALSRADDPARSEGFVQNVRTLRAMTERDGTKLILATMPFWQEKFASGVLWGEGMPEAVGRRVRANNERIRELAAEFGVPLVEASDFEGDDVLYDDCHFTRKGEAQLAARMREAVLEVLGR